MQPYYQRDNVTLYHADCHDVLPLLEGVDSVITDPPYGVGWDADYLRIIGWSYSEHRDGKRRQPVRGKMHRTIIGDGISFSPKHLLQHRRVILWGFNAYPDKLPGGSVLVWDKRMSARSFLSDGEVAWMNSGHGTYIFSFKWGGFVRDGENGTAYHPAQKPVALYEWCINKAKPKGLLVDPYGGAGWGAVAAYRLNIPFVGIEIEEKYCETAARRVEGAQRYIAPLVDDVPEQLSLIED